ncbi:hypothetical protein IAT38_002398 [Cryptococcus sp. DSM 104549]
MPSASPLPPHYYYFFLFLEPILTIAGAFRAIVDPTGFARDLVPVKIERASSGWGGSIRGRAVTSELGSCFLLLALISLSLFRLFKKHLEDKPMLQEKMVKGLLVPLAIADILHIAVTLLQLPMSHLQSPSQWTYLLHSTVWITTGLFITRVSWLLGIARGSPSSPKHQISPSTSPRVGHKTLTGQMRVPLPKAEAPKPAEVPAASPAAPAVRESPRRAAKAVAEDEKVGVKEEPSAGASASAGATASATAVETATPKKRGRGRPKKIVNDD